LALSGNENAMTASAVGLLRNPRRPRERRRTAYRRVAYRSKEWNAPARRASPPQLLSIARINRAEVAIDGRTDEDEFASGRDSSTEHRLAMVRIRNLRSGRDEYLLKDHSFGWVFDARFSPRGDQFVLFWNRELKRPLEHGLWLLSWPGREERQLTSEVMCPFGWSADGEWIYASRCSGRDVFRVSTRTGKTEPVGQFPIGTLELGSCDLLPDRSAIICSLAEQQADAWIMENFDDEIR
jgi:hypothetical protein